MANKCSKCGSGTALADQYLCSSCIENEGENSRKQVSEFKGKILFRLFIIVIILEVSGATTEGLIPGLLLDVYLLPMYFIPSFRDFFNGDNSWAITYALSIFWPPSLVFAYIAPYVLNLVKQKNINFTHATSFFTIPHVWALLVATITALWLHYR